MAVLAAGSSSTLFFRPFITSSESSHSNPKLSLSTPHSTQISSFKFLSHTRRRNTATFRVFASISAPVVQSGPDDLVSSILSKVTDSDRGVKLTGDEHKEVGVIAEELRKYCVDAPVKCPLIFGEWDVVYCSNPTSPGGGYRSAIGRLIFKTEEMIQAVEAPATIRNRVSFSLFGFLDGQVSLKGKLIALDEQWIQVIFEPPELKVGGI